MSWPESLVSMPEAGANWEYSFCCFLAKQAGGQAGVRATHANEPPFTRSDCGHTSVKSTHCQMKGEIKDIVRFRSDFYSFHSCISHFVH